MSEWKPIETAPRDGSHMLLWASSGFNRAVIGKYSSRANNKGGGWVAQGGFVVSNPTHWMPLPDPPDRQSSEGKAQ